MRNYGHRTILIIDSAHEPTPGELEAVASAALATGKQQGFEPFRAIGAPPNPNEEAVKVVDQETLDAWKRSLS